MLDKKIQHMALLSPAITRFAQCLQRNFMSKAASDHQYSAILFSCWTHFRCQYIPYDIVHETSPATRPCLSSHHIHFPVTVALTLQYVESHHSVAMSSALHSIASLLLKKNSKASVDMLRGQCVLGSTAQRHTL